MNIALFASAFHPHIGGVEEHVRQLAHAQRKMGMKPIVITNQWPPELPVEEEFEGIPVYRLPMRIPEGDFKTRLKFRLTHARITGQMLDILKKHDSDLLHVHCVSSNGYYALLARQSLGLPLVTTTHGERTMDASQVFERSAFFNHILRTLLRESDAVTACSRDTLDDMERYWGASLGERASVVYNGIEVSDFACRAPFQHSKPYILGIGRLVPQKGFDLLIEAFARANLESHDLLLAGEGSERESLEKLARERKVENRVRFVGRADRATVVSLFQGCSFFVLSSRQEPFGIVNLEAMAAGRAIVAACVGGVPEIVFDNENGVLFAGEDVVALAEAITRLAGDEALRERLGANGQMRVRGFAWPSIARRYLDVYERVSRRATASLA